MWQIRFTRNADKDKKLLVQANLEQKVKMILNVMAEDPFIVPPPYEKLIGDLKGYYSRRINFHHRIVYSVDETYHEIIIHAMWTHYSTV